MRNGEYLKRTVSFSIEIDQQEELQVRDFNKQ